jgi:hypothetical protein
VKIKICYDISKDCFYLKYKSFLLWKTVKREIGGLSGESPIYIRKEFDKQIDVYNYLFKDTYKNIDKVKDPETLLKVFKANFSRDTTQSIINTLI